MSGPSYSKYQETLIALVTHLAITDKQARSAKALAEDLSIDQSEVDKVLDSFRGLFWRSPGQTKGPPDYSLHFRFARSGRAALESKDLIELLKFISEKAAGESQRSSAMIIALITAGLGLAAGLASLVVTLVRPS
jgi:hypothetical protein